MGFDNYTKGSTQAAAAQRRKNVQPDQYRVFSRSSITYNALNAAAAGDSGGSGANTPAGSATPVSSTFGGATGTKHPTPVPRDRKKKSVVLDAGESESDARESKKVRTNFGAGRK